MTSLCHNLSKALRGRKSGTWALNDTETLKLGEELALQKIISVFNQENNEAKKPAAQMALLRPSEPSRCTGASRVRSLETLGNFLVSPSKGPKPFYLRLTIFFIQTTFRQRPYTQICTHWKYDTVLCARNTRDNICVKGITPASNTKEITLQITMLVVSF